MHATKKGNSQAQRGSVALKVACIAAGQREKEDHVKACQALPWVYCS